MPSKLITNRSGLVEPANVAQMRYRLCDRRTELHAEMDKQGSAMPAAKRAELRGINRALNHFDQGNNSSDAKGFSLVKSLWGGK